MADSKWRLLFARQRTFWLGIVLVVSVVTVAALLRLTMFQPLETKLVSFIVANNNAQSFDVVVSSSVPLDLQVAASTGDFGHFFNPLGGANLASELLAEFPAKSAEEASFYVYRIQRGAAQTEAVTLKLFAAGEILTRTIANPDTAASSARVPNPYKGIVLNPKLESVNGGVLLIKDYVEGDLQGADIYSKLSDLSSAQGLQLAIVQANGGWSADVATSSGGRKLFYALTPEGEGARLEPISSLAGPQELTAIRVGKGATVESEFYAGWDFLRLPATNQSTATPAPAAPGLGSYQSVLGKVSALEENLTSPLADCSGDVLGCQAGSICNWQGGWRKKCIDPLQVPVGEPGGPATIFREFVAYCEVDGRIATGKVYSQRNDNCTASTIGQVLPNSFLNDACPGTNRLRSDPGGCEGLPTSGSFAPVVKVEGSDIPPATADSISLRITFASTAVSVCAENAQGNPVCVDGQTPALSINNLERLAAGVSAIYKFQSPGQLKFTALVPQTSGEVTVLTCPSAQLSFKAPGTEVYRQYVDGWTRFNSGAALDPSFQGADLKVELGGTCTVALATTEIPVPPITNTGGNPTLFPQALNPVCPLRPEDLASNYLFVSDWDTAGNHQGLAQIAPQHAVDIRPARNETGSEVDFNQAIYAPVDGTVVDVRFPEETKAAFTRDGVFDVCGEGFDYYDGGIAVHIVDGSGNLWRFQHLEQVTLQEGQSVTKGVTALGKVFDGRFEGADAGLSNYNDNTTLINGEVGCYRSADNPHTHFAIVSSAAVNVTSPVNYSGNEFYAADFIASACAGPRLKERRTRYASASGLPQLVPVIHAEVDGSRDGDRTLPERLLPPAPGGYRVSINGQQSATAEVRITPGTASLRYYHDQNNDGIRQSTENYLSSGEIDTLGVSLVQTAAAFIYDRNNPVEDLRLQRGWNLLGLPFVNGQLSKASDLYNEVQRQAVVALGREVTLSIASLESAGNFSVYTAVAGGTTSAQALSRDFSLIPGQGIYLYTDEAFGFTLFGVPLQQSFTGTYRSGWNLLNLPEFSGQEVQNLFSLGIGSRSVSQLARYQSGTFQTTLRDSNSGELFGPKSYQLHSQRGYWVELAEAESAR